MRLRSVLRLRSLLHLPLVATLASHAAAQTPDAAAPHVGATVGGVVYDSVAGGALAGAMVQIAAADGPGRFSRSTTSDSLGRFALTDVPDGRYTLGFFHPALDALGVEAPLHAVVVADRRPVHVDLAIPSPARLRAAICRGQSGSDASGVIVGTVRDAADGAPVAGARVTARWAELSFTKQGLVRATPTLVATTGPTGWFAVCGVPPSGTSTLVAVAGADSTARVDVEVPADGFAHRALYVGRGGAAADGPPAVESALTGTVVTATGGTPLAGAVVRIDGAAEARANERGEWSLPRSPLGTRMLEVRAVGYYPERRPVDVVAGAAPVRVALATLRSVLDTVKISATASARARERAGFVERRRSTAGQFMAAADIARRAPVATSKLFLNMAGVRIGFATDTLATLDSPSIPVDAMRETDRRILMRGTFHKWCAPAIYVDGTFLPELGADDIDALLAPEDVGGIEVYTRATVPGPFAQGLNECGAVVFWRK